VVTDDDDAGTNGDRVVGSSPPSGLILLESSVFNESSSSSVSLDNASGTRICEETGLKSTPNARFRIVVARGNGKQEAKKKKKEIK
jgi:hypothetical protein